MNKKKGRKNSPLWVASVKNESNKDIAISHDRMTENSYIVTYKGVIKRRIYLLQNDGWYIWNEQLGFRIKVKNFTTAINIVEKELSVCVG